MDEDYRNNSMNINTKDNFEFLLPKSYFNDL